MLIVITVLFIVLVVIGLIYFAGNWQNFLCPKGSLHSFEYGKAGTYYQHKTCSKCGKVIEESI